jgi:hypothetical protein
VEFTHGAQAATGSGLAQQLRGRGLLVHGLDTLALSTEEDLLVRNDEGAVSWAFPVTADNTAFVLWTSTWQSSGGGVAEFCNPIYQALLADLKSTFDSA